MKDECLICEEKKSTANQKCKLCGMSASITHPKNKDFIFCSQKCMHAFDDIYKASSESQKLEMYNKEIII